MCENVSFNQVKMFLIKAKKADMFRFDIYI